MKLNTGSEPVFSFTATDFLETRKAQASRTSRKTVMPEVLGKGN